MVVQQIGADFPLESLLLAELGQLARELFEQVASLPCGIPLLSFLHDHPNTFSTVDSIAFRLNQSHESVESSLHGLLRLRLVQRLDVGPTLWSLTNDSRMRDAAGELVEWQNRWRVRLARVEQAIEGKSSDERVDCSAKRDGTCGRESCMTCSTFLFAAVHRLQSEMSQ